MREFIEEISNLKNIKQRDLIEKDILIQKILLELSKDEFFLKNLCFQHVDFCWCYWVSSGICSCLVLQKQDQVVYVNPSSF